MEMEFDKEMNAILRRYGGRTDGSAAVGKHVDADMIAAFSENALPPASRKAVIAHLSDCSPCRATLSDTIRLAESADEPSAAPAVEAVEAKVPWFSKLFARQFAVAAMGVLVIGLAGILIYRISNRVEITDVARINEAPDRSYSASANNAANAAPGNSETEQKQLSPGAMGNVSVTAPPSLPMSRERTGIADGDTTKDAPLLDREQPAPPPVSTAGGAAPEPPRPAAAKPAEDVAADKTETAKRKEDPAADDLALRSQSTRRDMPPAPANSGPVRSGPAQTKSNQIGNVYGEMAVTRRVGGKSFENRDGAWYDTAYRGQATKNISRNSEEYWKLDSGLRSIASSIGGVVVVVWKGTAYRIS